MFSHVTVGARNLERAGRFYDALLFSTARMIAFYSRLGRWLQGLFSALFAGAGLKLLVSPD
ncbi:hypothetical protein ACAW63_17975 [Pseudomonas sp. QE6]|uniref:hypothetical protein n=1 Tax=Pseudomonas sp. QE6 TaxID=3242491 RepID=UPI0035280B83